jgi:GTP cyclohydrolase IA
VTTYIVNTRNGHGGNLSLVQVAVQCKRDMVAAQAAARALFAALGLNLGEESLANTPARFASGLAELLTPREFNATTFPNDTGYRQLVIECDIPFRSLCEHHVLPFWGTAHVGYLPGPRILGLSKLARLVEHFAARPQVQERLTDQVADWLQTHLAPEGTGVIMTAEHTCMTLRGARAQGTRTITSAFTGSLQASADARREFTTMIGMS